jgi:hypothetical protein
MTAQSIVVVLGGLLILIGVLGGGFEVKELRVPKIAGMTRGLSLIGGIVLIGIGITVLKGEGQRVIESEPPPAPSEITVVAGTYGKNCGASYGNKTAHLESLCNARASCSYVIDYQIIGDPVPGCKKEYEAEWKCGADKAIHSAVASAEAGYKSPLLLTCP